MKVSSVCRRMIRTDPETMILLFHVTPVLVQVTVVTEPKTTKTSLLKPEFPKT
jgi:hypothetical protein